MGVTDLHQLAMAVGVPDSFLSNVVHNLVDPYQEFGIPKRQGNALRIISAPSSDLTKVQQHILRNLLSDLGRSESSFAYHQGVSIKACAAVHAPSKWLVKLDLENFFESISAHRVQSDLEGLGFSGDFSAQLAALCTRRSSQGRKRSLPQGAPTSGMLANLAAAKLDVALSSFAMNNELRYTRYSDDLTFSSSGDFTRAFAMNLVRRVRSKVAGQGFKLNETKIRIRPPGSRLVVLGLLVDSERPRLRNDFKRMVEWQVYGSERFGIPQYSESRKFETIEGYLWHVDGLFAHALDVQPEWAEPIWKKWKYISNAPAGRMLGPLR